MNIIAPLIQFFSLLKHHLPDTLAFVSIFWLIHCVNFLCRYRLNLLGIVPREPLSLIAGPWCASFLHADFNHLIYNSFPLVVMVSFLFSQGVVKAITLILSISLLKSLLVWLFARPGIHIGASGLIMGLLSHLMFQGYYKPSIVTLLTAFLMFYYFGALLLSILPSEDLRSSFEGHFAGLVSGIVISVFGPLPLLKPIALGLSSMILAISKVMTF